MRFVRIEDVIGRLAEQGHPKSLRTVQRVMSKKGIRPINQNCRPLLYSQESLQPLWAHFGEPQPHAMTPDDGKMVSTRRLRSARKGGSK